MNTVFSTKNFCLCKIFVHILTLYAIGNQLEVCNVVEFSLGPFFSSIVEHQLQTACKGCNAIFFHENLAIGIRRKCCANSYVLACVINAAVENDHIIGCLRHESGLQKIVFPLNIRETCFTYASTGIGYVGRIKAGSKCQTSCPRSGGVAICGRCIIRAVTDRVTYKESFFAVECMCFCFFGEFVDAQCCIQFSTGKGLVSGYQNVTVIVDTAVNRSFDISNPFGNNKGINSKAESKFFFRIDSIIHSLIIAYFIEICVIGS